MCSIHVGGFGLSKHVCSRLITIYSSYLAIVHDIHSNCELGFSSMESWFFGLFMTDVAGLLAMMVMKWFGSVGLFMVSYSATCSNLVCSMVCIGSWQGGFM